MKNLIDEKLRLLTKEEVSNLPKSLEEHPLLENRARSSKKYIKMLANDIKRNGMTQPIVIHNSLIDPDDYEIDDNEPEYRSIVIIEGYKRYIAARNAGFRHIDLPFAEFMGTDEEVKTWLRRERDIRTHDDTKTRVIHAIEVTLPDLRLNKEWKKHPLYDAKMKGRDDLAAKMDGISRTNIHKGIEIKETDRVVYQAMSITDLSLEDAYKCLHSKTWTVEWIKKAIKNLYTNPHPSIRSLIKKLEYEIDFVEEIEKTPRTQFQDAPVEDVKAKGKLIVQMDKIQSESNIEFKRRAKGFTEALTTLANQWGITNVHVITGTIGKTLIDEALNKTFEIEGALIETIALEKQQAKAIEEEELATYSVEQIAPDEKIQKQYQQHIGKKK